MLKKYHRLWVTISLLTLFAPPAAISQVQERPPAAGTASSDRRYQVGPGDLLDIRVFREQALTREVRVSDLGRIRLPFLDEIDAACLTEAELAGVIAEKYRRFVRNPQVDVFVKEYNSQPVSVIGSVTRPGRIQLQRRVRLLELISFAGGPAPLAGEDIHVIRAADRHSCQAGDESAAEAAPGGQRFYSYKLRDLLAGAAEANIVVEPSDIVSLPPANQVFVTGTVVRPGPLTMPGRMTLVQAISMAGGFAQYAEKKKVRLIRLQPGSNTHVERIVNIDEIEKRRGEDIVLLPNDVIDVPGSKGIARTLVQMFAQTAAQLPLYVLY